MISMTLNAETPELLLIQVKGLFPSLAGTPLPPMQEQPTRDQPAPQKQEVIPPEPKKPPKNKKPEPETIDAVANEPKAEIPDIEALRAKLKALGAAEGEGKGHDAVFELLGKYGAKNATTVPEDRRAEVIGAIDAILEVK